MKFFRYLLFSMLTASAFACHKAPISQEETVRLIVQILYTEQQINREISLSALADTCLIYEAILQKEGYTQAQFQQAIKQHIKQPDQFRKALEQGKRQVQSTKASLQAQIQKLRKSVDSSAHIRPFVFGWPVDSIPFWVLQTPDSLPPHHYVLWPPDSSAVSQAPAPFFSVRPRHGFTTFSTRPQAPPLDVREEAVEELDLPSSKLTPPIPDSVRLQKILREGDSLRMQLPQNKPRPR